MKDAYTILEIEDLPNEQWVDVLGFDGIYQLSNLGRFKSLQREVNTQWNTQRIVKEKILKQSIVKAENGRLDGLIVSIGKTRNCAIIIYKSFYPNNDFKKNECIMHKNKNVLDNRIDNLIKVTRKKSRQVDVIKSVRTIKCLPKNLEKANQERKEFYEKITHKKCLICELVQLKSFFYYGRNTCKNCFNKKK